MKLTGEQAKELQNICEILITEGIIWEDNLPNTYVYSQDEMGSFLELKTIADDTAYLLERIRNLLEENKSDDTYEQ